MSFLANYCKKYVQKVEILSFYLILSQKWYDLTWPCNSPKFNFYHLQKISTGFKMVVLRNWVWAYPPHQIFGNEIFQKQKKLEEKLSNVRNQASMACVRFEYESKIIRSSLQASFPELTMLFKACSCDMYLLHLYAPLQILKSFQAPFNPFSNSCLSKIRMKIWVKEPYIGELHTVPTKFRNKFLSFHYLKKAIAQKNEREINLIQRAYILT